MTTTMSINSQISFSIRGSSASTPIQIDWGNGVKENYTIGDSDEAFGFPIKGSTIKIWGSGVEGFNIQAKNLTALTFSDATALKTLFCKNNQLTTLNLTGCGALTLVECKQNLITSLTLPNTTTLTYVDCSDNNLTLATLPLKQATWTEYIYSPQKDYALPKTVYTVNEEIDLSSQLSINSNTTSYIWKTSGGTTLVNGVDYNVAGGKFTFLKSFNESIFCEMTNVTFTSLTLKTISISIPPTPAVIMTTTNAIGSTFSFSIEATEDNTPIQVDWGNGFLMNYTIETNTSSISGTIAGSTIKIYGADINFLDLRLKELTTLDVTKTTSLTRLWCYENQLTTLDLTKNTVINEVLCNSNQLTSLDVTKNSTLTTLWCHNNQLTTLDVTQNTALTNLGCGSNKLTTLDVTKITSLTSLWCNSNQLNALDVSKNTLLGNLECSSNKLTTLDLTKNTALTNLGCNNNLLTTLDITNNTNLFYLQCSSNPLSAIDVTMNTALTRLYCYSNQLSTLDITKNNALINLHCGSNKLTTLDITKNTLLTDIDCGFNQLTTLDVTMNAALKKLTCNSNLLTFNTLPIKQSNWTDYIYNPQSILKLPKTNYKIDEIIDLSNQLTAGGNATIYDWKTAGGAKLVKNVDYTEDNGVFKFIKAQAEYVNCQMTNASFPELTITTEKFSVLPIEPAITMTTTTAIGNSQVYKIGATANNTPIQVDWGNSTLTSYTIGINSSYVTGILTGNIIKIYGTGISELEAISKQLIAIDVSNNTTLNYLCLAWNQITTLDLSKNTALTNLNCGNNQLSSLDVSKNTVLTRLSCYGNQLKVLDLSNSIVLTWLDCLYNQLTTLDVSKNTTLNYLCCSNNKITTLDVSNNTSLKEIICDENQLSSLDVSKNTELTYLNCYKNNLTALDLSNNVSLTNLNCSHSNISFLDVSKNISLTDLGCTINQLTSLDVSKNTKLLNFSCSDNNLTALDISKNILLKNLWCYSNPLSIMDITKNSELNYLDCHDNQLSVLDISKNTALTSLNCGTNQLTALDVTMNTALTTLNCFSNQLTFSTLPIKQPTWTTYTYSHQKNMVLQKKNYTLSESIDLNSQLSVNGNITGYIWKTKGGTTLIAGTDYNLTNGVTTFLKVQTDSVYCQMTNATFPGLTLSTSSAKITQFPTSVDETKMRVNIHPNPLKEFLNITYNENITKVDVFTITGVKVYEMIGSNTNTMTVPALTLPKGMLIVKIHSRNGVLEQKIVKE